MALARIAILDLSARADCSCCGSESTHGHPVFTAGLVDSDMVLYPRLCGGCFDMIEAEIGRETTVTPQMQNVRNAARRTFAHTDADEDRDFTIVPLVQFVGDAAA